MPSSQRFGLTQRMCSTQVRCADGIAALVVILAGCAPIVKSISFKDVPPKPSSDRWVGVYQLPVQDQVGAVVADFSSSGDSVVASFVFKNETLGFRGSGTFQGQVQGERATPGRHCGCGKSERIAR